MRLIPETADPDRYLAADEAIDHDHPVVARIADRLRREAGGGAEDPSDPEAYARAAFAFVRDAIPHSFDSGDPRVAWRASDVLASRNGICYAKSHALAALLRRAGIPAALCYQVFDVIHGLVAVKLPGRSWARQDPRGNKPGVDARFSLDGERLAFTPDPARGEFDHPTLFATPPAPVRDALRAARDRAHLERLLPAELPPPPRLDAAALGAARLGRRATLVHFATAFCQPCRATRRILARVAGMVDGVDHVEVDAESRPELVRPLRVARTPFLLVLDADGRVMRRAAGQPRVADVVAALGAALPG
jgi:hypothetical protein